MPLHCSNSWIQSVTRAHAHSAALRRSGEKDLNRHLKSLRNERKKDRKSSAKRAGEKDRCSKKRILSP